MAEKQIFITSSAFHETLLDAWKFASPFIQKIFCDMQFKWIFSLVVLECAPCLVRKLYPVPQNIRGDRCYVIKCDPVLSSQPSQGLCIPYNGLVCTPAAASSKSQ